MNNWHACVCMYAYVCVRTWVCLLACTRVRVYVFMHLYIRLPLILCRLISFSGASDPATRGIDPVLPHEVSVSWAFGSTHGLRAQFLAQPNIPSNNVTQHTIAVKPNVYPNEIILVWLIKGHTDDRFSVVRWNSARSYHRSSFALPNLPMIPAYIS